MKFDFLIWTKKVQESWKISLARWFWAFYAKNQQKSEKNKLDFERFSRQTFLKVKNFDVNYIWKNNSTRSNYLTEISSWVERHRLLIRSSDFRNSQRFLYLKCSHKLLFLKKHSQAGRKSSKSWPCCRDAPLQQAYVVDTDWYTFEVKESQFLCF